MDTQTYLQRIGLSGENITPNIETLRAIHVAHLYTVPFENLDISLGRPIELDLQRIYEKVVERRRGGFCYELNGLLAWLLQELGYSVTLLSASSFNDDRSHAPEYDHLVLLVTCPGDETRWLADVGWGSGFEEPLRLEHAFAQESGRFIWRVDKKGASRSLWQKTAAGDWIPHYRFTLTPREYQDFAGMCIHHQTSPESMFTRKKLCTIFMPDRRVTLSDSKLIVTKNDAKEELDVSEDEVPEILSRYFGVVLY
jgi:N-hydroxyarylamine O-acetyltransferase